MTDKPLSLQMAESDSVLLYWIDMAPGEFHVSQLSKDSEFQFLYLEKLERLVDLGYLERVGSKRGWYRRRIEECKPLDFLNTEINPCDIWLPLRLSEYVQIHPGNLIIIAGSPNSGKSAFMLNIIKENMREWDIHYFSSEMGASELSLRLQKFPDLSIDMWNFQAYRRGSDFSDVIRSGEGKLNIIDFLEVHDEFYIISRRLKEIHDRLDGALAVVGVQKNPGSDTGLGGWRSMEVTRLAVALDYGRCKITKAKNFVNPEKNPNGWVIDFKLIDGCRIIPSQTGWYRVDNKNQIDIPKI